MRILNRKASRKTPGEMCAEAYLSWRELFVPGTISLRRPAFHSLLSYLNKSTKNLYRALQLMEAEADFTLGRSKVVRANPWEWLWISGSNLYPEIVATNVDAFEAIKESLLEIYSRRLCEDENRRSRGWPLRRRNRAQERKFHRPSAVWIPCKEAVTWRDPPVAVVRLARELQAAGGKTASRISQRKWANILAHCQDWQPG